MPPDKYLAATRPKGLKEPMAKAMAKKYEPQTRETMRNAIQAFTKGP
jgi:hypothetical protein